MAKYHVNPKTGEVGKCNSKQGKCPFGGEGIHRDSIADAQQLADEINIAHAYTITGNFKSGEKFNNMFSTLTCGNCDEEDQVKLIARGILELGGGETDVEINNITKLPSNNIAKDYYIVDYTDGDGDKRNIEIYKESNGKWFCEHIDYDNFYDKVSREADFSSDVFSSPYEYNSTIINSKLAKLTLSDIDKITFKDGDDFNRKFNVLKLKDISNPEMAKLIAKGINSLSIGNNFQMTKVEEMPANKYFRCTFNFNFKDKNGYYKTLELFKTYGGKWTSWDSKYTEFYNKISNTEGFDYYFFDPPFEA